MGEQVEEILGVAKQHLLVLELADMAKGRGIQKITHITCVCAAAESPVKWDRPSSLWREPGGGGTRRRRSPVRRWDSHRSQKSLTGAERS